MGALTDLRLTWNFLHPVTEIWSSHPGTYKAADEAEDLIPALAQMCIRAFARGLRESVSKSELNRSISGQLTKQGGERLEVTLSDLANKVTHGSPGFVVAGSISWACR
jgi:hypothetical protein